MADLAVVIVSYNSRRWLGPCLASVYGHAGGIDLDVVVADNESTDRSPELVEDRFPAARVLRCSNRGFAYGNNAALLDLSAPFALLLNADTEIRSGTFAELLERLRRRPSVGAVGVRQVTPDGVLYPTIRRFPSAGRLFFEALGSERFPFRAGWLGERELDPRAYERDTACDWTSGSFLLIRRDALLAAGLLDERFFMYCEEPDLCLRIKRAGWEVRHDPGMTIVHHAGRLGRDARLAAQDAFARRQYMEKHFSPLARRAGLLSYGLGVLLRAASGSRRPASLAALRALRRSARPPFLAPPAVAVDSDAHDADAVAATRRVRELEALVPAAQRQPVARHVADE